MHTGSAYIIATGEELIRGEVTDENSPWLARVLASLGFPVQAVLLVGDDAGVITGAIETARTSGPSVVVLTGGLGPTEDDRTRDAVAGFLGVPLEEHPGLASKVSGFLREQGRRPSAGALRQALLPRGAVVIPNPEGTASGFMADGRGLRLIVLPGPPTELRATAGEDLSGIASALPGSEGVPVVLRLDSFGMAEAEVDGRLNHVREMDGILVGTLSTGGVVSVILSARGPGGREKVEEARIAVIGELGANFFGEGGGTLAQALVTGLGARGLTLALAESCTGGLLGHMVTSVPGASEVFREGVVAYANEVKIERLGVPADLLDRVGAVSAEVAKSMARGIADRAGADLGVSVTGIAGPGGGTPDKPVGLTYIAVSFRGRDEVRRLHLGGMSRGWVKRLSALSALDLARRVVSRGNDEG